MAEPVAGPSTSRFDYTEGASAIDISNAVAKSRRARRDSQYSQAYEESGSMFDGPGHSVIPSSVSRMGHHRSLSRRRSEDSQATGRRRRQSIDSAAEYASDAVGSDEEDVASARPSRRGRRSPSPSAASPTRRGVLSGITHLFGRETLRRRPSISARSSASSRRSGRRSNAGSEAGDTDEEGDDRWGYSSGEEDTVSEDEDITRSPEPMGSEYGSNPPSPTRSIDLPLMPGDQFFGDDTRIEIDLGPLDEPSDGPPSRQMLHLHDEDMTVRFVGYETVHTWQTLWRVACILSAGILALLGHWFPKLWLRWVTRELSFGDIKHGFILVEVGF